MPYFVHVIYKSKYRTGIHSTGCDRLLIIDFKQKKVLDWKNLTTARPRDRLQFK